MHSTGQDKNQFVCIATEQGGSERIRLKGKEKGSLEADPLPQVDVFCPSLTTATYVHLFFGFRDLSFPR